MQLTTKQISNFFKKVNKTKDCWLWTGYKDINGYGKVCINKKVYFAHRISLVINGFNLEPSKKEKGSKGQIVMHVCDTPNCVNFNHLKISTHIENMKDAKNKGRKWKGELSGENNPKSKLTWNDIDLIRNNNFSVKNFKEKYSSINKSQYYLIKNNKSWIPA